MGFNKQQTEDADGAESIIDEKVTLKLLQDIKQLLMLQLKIEGEKVKAMMDIRDAIKERR